MQDGINSGPDNESVDAQNLPPEAGDGQISSADQPEIFGTFHIGGNEFAMPVTAIQEVVNEPSAFTNIPLSPDYLVGLFNLRGLIIPVVDLRVIFNLCTNDDDKQDRKVAIIEYGEHCFGLLVDKTGDVFNARDVDRSGFTRARGDAREAVVGGVFKMENGARLVQILDPFELLNLEKLPKVAGASSSALTQKKRGRRKQCISFKIGTSLCAFDMTSVKEIVELKAIDNTALAHGATLGAINLRGLTVPVIDFRVFLGAKSHSSASNLVNQGYKLIVMKNNEHLISFLVDSIDNIISFFDDDLVSFPTICHDRDDMFQGCLDRGDAETVLLLNHEKILTNEELSKVTRGHSDLFREADENDGSEQRGQSTKRTFITFSINSKFALEIEKVNEVISYPEAVVRPPSLPDYIDGMVNLRGDLIPIINLRSLYVLDAVESSVTKLLVFSRADKKYAMMVDTVDEIVNVSDENANVLPKVGTGSAELELTSAVKETILLTGVDTKKQSLMVLDIDMVVSKTVAAMAA